MLVVTSEQVAGHRVRQTLGQCFGVVVRSRGLGGNIMAGWYGKIAALQKQLGLPDSAAAHLAPYVL